MNLALFVLTATFISGPGGWVPDEAAMQRERLPVGTDTIAVTYEAKGASKRVSQALPDWNVVMMPPISYGQGGANQLGDMPVHPGTYGEGSRTKRRSKRSSKTGWRNAGNASRLDNQSADHETEASDSTRR